jgi:hypothetical protein
MAKRGKGETSESGLFCPTRISPQWFMTGNTGILWIQNAPIGELVQVFLELTARVRVPLESAVVSTEDFVDANKRILGGFMGGWSSPMGSRIS